jgi:predicted DsbA family dithiol-disulfide isomerase
VPFFVVGEHYGVSGAQNAETLLAVLNQWWDENPDPAAPAEAAVCGPDGCAE